MATDRTRPLETLLAEAEAAHGVYETTELNGVYDKDWPAWYAAYAVDHGIGAILGRDVTVDELAQALATSWNELKAADPQPTDPWTTSIARRLAAEL